LAAGRAGATGSDGRSEFSSAMAHPFRKITPASQPTLRDKATASKP
jgi:hypothetical protein